MTYTIYGELALVSGSANQGLAREISEHLETPLVGRDITDYPNENVFIRMHRSVRSQDVFIIQPTSSPVNRNLMELLIMIDCVKRASAGRITAVIPYFSYGRTDKKDQPRVPITARLIADLLTVAGANRLLTVDLHAAQIQGFFSIPVDELTALNMLSHYFKDRAFDDLVVVATDIGISKRARDLAAQLNTPLAIMEKRRTSNTDQTETLNVIGEVEGRVALTVDDEIDTGGSLVSTVAALQEQGAKEVYACCTHPVFSGSAIQRIASSPVKEVVVTDTLPVSNEKKLDKITVLPIAPLLGEAIHRIHTGLSVGAMFE